MSIPRLCIALLCWVTAAWLLSLVLRARRSGEPRTRRQDNTLRLLWVIGAAAIALTLSLEPITRALDSATGRPGVTDHVKHLVGLVPIRQAMVQAELLAGTSPRYRLRSVSEWISRRWLVVALLLQVCFHVNNDPSAMLERDNGLGGHSGLIYWLVFMGYFLNSALAFTRQALRFRHQTREPTAQRAGMSVLAIGGAGAITYGLSRVLGAVLASGNGAVLSAATANVGNLALVVAFTAICYGQWRSRNTSPPSWLLPHLERTANLTRTSLLRDMARALRAASPSSSAGLVVLNPRARLLRREREISDGISDLTEWMHEDDEAHARRLLHAQRDDEALLLATRIELARRRKLDGREPSAPSAPAQHDDGPMLQRLAAVYPQAVDLAEVVQHERNHAQRHVRSAGARAKGARSVR
ncbi:DUF6545 domain-containing protein [Kineococcus sp. SYSU DK005]|uniref:DUF6545 domain-containing protein n=1 Tax=Kineococcus sp. SYSU DK005 TaxID=3383126 RepID=UPI003D7E6133